MCFMCILYFLLYPNLSVSIAVTNYLIIGSLVCLAHCIYSVISIGCVFEQISYHIISYHTCTLQRTRATQIQIRARTAEDVRIIFGSIRTNASALATHHIMANTANCVSAWFRTRVELCNKTAEIQCIFLMLNLGCQ